MDKKMRLVTRSDFDGLACAMMLKELKLIDEIKFVHPKDVQDGKIELSKNDITTNLPFDPRVGIAFDHHESEVDRLKATETGGKLIIDPNARSAARVVYDYYGGKASVCVTSSSPPPAALRCSRPPAWHKEGFMWLVGPGGWVVGGGRQREVGRMTPGPGAGSS